MDEKLVKAMIEFWDPSFRCFSFNRHDLTLTMEEISTFLRLGPLETRPIYYKGRNLTSFRKRLSQVLDHDFKADHHYIEQKGNTSVISWQYLRKYIQEQFDNEKALDAFALAIGFLLESVGTC